MKTFSPNNISLILGYILWPIKRYVEGIHNREFNYKISTLILLSVMLVITFHKATPEQFRIIAGSFSLAITLILGMFAKI